ncbi:lysylphosphatidylglycerol synthase transmembrane domain-containing protein [Methanospirillum lacunae]|uniref:Lysylphosphatidylglycerol synthetase n=1 Tax=Methanospirillum lacunae TaxID=668570 RepID=A0A2V2N7J6_9EURY|nr:flippase-like domain-containing protein [Methanospirillum lacunae]PWR71243.1 lysylphosphatidylglycerol synthetase [Methanospirillum lacunae]
MKFSSRTLFAISILFSLVVLAIVFATTFTKETISYILAFNFYFLILSIGFRILALIFWGVRIQVLSRALGYRVPLPHAVNMVLAGLFAGTITPGQSGGEPVRIHELYRVGVKVGDATAVVITERILDGIILTILGIGIMTITGSIWSTFSLSMIILIIIAWVCLISVALIPILMLRYPVRMKSLIMRLITWISAKLSGTRFSTSRILEHADEEIDNFFESFSKFAGPAAWGLIAGGGITALFWVTEFMVASVILMGLGLEPHILLSFLFQIIIAIVMMIPLTPGSSGITEISTSSLYALIVPSATLGFFVLLWRFVTFYLNIILGSLAGLVIVHREVVVRSKNKDEE